MAGFGFRLMPDPGLGWSVNLSKHQARGAASHLLRNYSSEVISRREGPERAQIGRWNLEGVEPSYQPPFELHHISSQTEEQVLKFAYIGDGE